MRLIADQAVVLLAAFILASVLSVAQNADQQKMQNDVDAEPRAVRQIMLDQKKGKVGEGAPNSASSGIAATSTHRALERNFVPDVLADQKAFWTRPLRPKVGDINWLVLFLASTSLSIATDTSTEGRLSTNPTRIARSRDLSNLGTALLAGTAGGLYLGGYVSHNEHAKETGVLSSEAFLNSLAVSSAIQLLAGRERPTQGNGKGRFWHGGTSFPSNHAAAAWSIASVLAQEYPGPMTKLLAYGAASAVSLTRVTGRKHFTADVFVGSAIGWYFGRQAYRAHHNPELGGPGWDGLLSETEHPRTPANMGSPYVPLDSWIYPSLERLSALGYIRTATLGSRPWTRLECTRLLSEASDVLQPTDGEAVDREAFHIYNSLARELSMDIALVDGGQNRYLQIDSIYTRATGISGTPLADGYHFGQTIANDYGRNFAGGFNTVAGFSGTAANGPFTVYIRAEYQHTPLIPTLSPQARQFIASARTDGNTLPVPPDTPTPAFDHLRLLDACVAMNFENWQLSFGQQSLWWGPSEGGPMMFSNNAAPVTMLRVDRVSPFRFPWIFGLMGPTRWQFLVGRLSGHDFVFGTSTGLVGQWGSALRDQPFIIGQKLDFKPTPNFEFGIEYTRIAGGYGQPFTLHQFVKSTFGLGNGHPGSSRDPGDVRSGVDFNYRIPGIRKWLTLYGEAFDEDESSPLVFPRKSAFQGGLYMPRIPGVRKLDLRVEGGSTAPADFSDCNGCFYQNTRFVNSYTNRGNLMGSWIGRASQGEQAWSTYWLTSRNTIQVNYRHRKLDSQFFPGGGTVNDGGVRADFWLSTKVSLSAAVQYEKWRIPLLDSATMSNVTTSVELGFRPQDWSLHGR